MVKLADSVISAAHQGQHLAGVRIEDHHRNLRLGSRLHLRFVLAFPDLYSLGALFGHLIVHQLHSAFDRLRRGLLQVGIERGVDAIGLVVHLPLIQFADERFADQVHKIRRIAGFNVGRRKLQRRSFCFFRLSRVMAWVSTMLSSTRLRRSSARSGCRYGDK